MYGTQNPYGQQNSYANQHYQNPNQHSQYGNPRHSYQQQGGYSHQLSQAPPAGADPQLWQWFTSVDADKSGSITVTELQSALLNGNWTRFDLDTVKMLMSIFDTDRNGTISFTEFAGLWKYISDWQNVFRHFDRDRSGSIDAGELAQALQSFGYNLSPRLLSQIEQKYASEPTAGYAASSGITFDRFVRACVAVKTLTESFQKADTDRDGWIQVNYEQYMSMVLNAP